jgi:uncharacterized iron-regulated protein
MRNNRNIAVILTLVLIGLPLGCDSIRCAEKRCGFWVDVYRGEPVAYEDILCDISKADVIYLGERHSIERHHEIQCRIVRDLAGTDKDIILGLEQLEACRQPEIDRYNRGEITFDELAELTDWDSRWNNYEDYRPIIEAAHNAGGVIVGLNARKEIVRQVALKGLVNLPGEQRSELPDEIDMDDPVYKEHLANVMMVMAHVKDTPEMLDKMFTAQVCRDEMMAESLSLAVNSVGDSNSIAVVLCGSGHVCYGAGIPSRLKRRLPGINDRIFVLSGSGDVVLSEKMRAMSRDITISHQQLKCFERPVADYLHVVNLNGRVEFYEPVDMEK